MGQSSTIYRLWLSSLFTLVSALLVCDWEKILPRACVPPLFLLASAHETLLGILLAESIEFKVVVHDVIFKCLFKTK